MVLYSAKRTTIVSKSRKSGIVRRIPIEVWHEILDSATIINNRDEFGQSVLSEASLTFEKDNLTCFVPLEEQRQAFQNRLNVILVCQAWYAIALPFLWSHMRLEVRSWLIRPSMWVPSLQSDVWSRVRRLDIVCDLCIGPEEQERTNTQKFHRFLEKEIFPRVNKLQVLCAPHNLATGRYSLEPKVVFLQASGGSTPDFDSLVEVGCHSWVGSPHFWTSAYVLDLDLDMAHLSKEAHVDSPETDFPHLVRLSVHSVTSESIVGYIASRWKIPALQLLTLHVEEASTEMWFPLLVWASSTIKSLHLSTFYFEASALDDDSPIHLPHLTSLVLEHCFCTDWTRLLRAPQLRQIAFRDASMDIVHRLHRSKFATILTRSLEPFPTCTTVSFHRSEVDLEEIDEVTEPPMWDPRLWFSLDLAKPKERDLAVERGWLLRPSVPDDL